VDAVARREEEEVSTGHRRLGRSPRCIGCRMRVDLCLCAELETLETKTRFVLAMHTREANKPTNSGFLVKAMLPNTEIRIRGLRERIDFSDLHDAAVLFPMEDAEEIGSIALPSTIIVPDGTWPQARSSMRRELMGFRRVKLPPGPPAEFRLRTHAHADSLSTFEAIARLLGIVEGRELEERLMHVFRIMVERTMRVRGIRE
jgi:DTW domain-containing protein